MLILACLFSFCRSHYNNQNAVWQRHSCQCCRQGTNTTLPTSLGNFTAIINGAIITPGTGYFLSKKNPHCTCTVILLVLECLCIYIYPNIATPYYQTPVVWADGCLSLFTLDHILVMKIHCKITVTYCKGQDVSVCSMCFIQWVVLCYVSDW